MKKSAVLLRFCVLVAIALIGRGRATAGVITVDLGKTLQQTQTDAAGDMSNTVDYFAARAFYQNAGDFISGQLTYPGPGSPAAMTDVPGTYFFLNGGTAAGYYIAESVGFTSQADLDAAYPMGDYEYDLTASDPSNNTSSTITYSEDLYPANQPVVTADSFNGLQGLNPSQALTVNFNPLIDNGDFGGSDQDFSFFDVVTSGFGSDVYSTYAATPTTTSSFTIPAGTLDPNTAYSVLITFDNRFAGLDGSDVNQFQLFDTKTEVDFTTGSNTPEPGGFALATLGLAGLVAARRRIRTLRKAYY